MTAKSPVRKKRARRPRFVSKVKCVSPIRVPLDEDLWVKDIPTLRKKMIKDQGGLDPVLNEKLEKPCLDHDHMDGRVRGVLSQKTNTFEGFVLKLWIKHIAGTSECSISEGLRRLADYWETDCSNNKLHPGMIEDMKKKLKPLAPETIVRWAEERLGYAMELKEDKSEMVSEFLIEYARQLEEEVDQWNQCL